MTIALEIHFTLEHDEITIKDLRHIVGSHNFNLNLPKETRGLSVYTWVNRWQLANTHEAQIEHFHVSIRNDRND